ncbi:MAG: fibronectin type III domain-containing protein [Candidatus Omnitrophica bacterium]|nr:fibronectin type III domain-containing protein [Candidatus Omnitrophota bacterium]
MFRAPSADPTVEAVLAGRVLAIGGLDNLSRFTPHLHPFGQTKQTTLLAHDQSSVQSQTIGSAQCVNSIGQAYACLSPSDVQKAYNMKTIPTINDSLQNVALFELDGYLMSDIAAYETKFNLPNNNTAMLQNVLIDGFNGQPTYNGGNEEVTLDIEILIGIAPYSINKLYVYEAPNSLAGWIDEWNKIANDNTSKVISCSWGIVEYAAKTMFPIETFDQQVFQKMAAQGQEVFVASGDCGAYEDCSSATLSTDEPSSQPYVTGVGISALSVNADGTYKSEAASIYSGGGISQYNIIPSYQRAMASQALSASKVSQTMRNVPDVSLTADPAISPHAFFITVSKGTSGKWVGYGGSSISAPIWAAWMAQVNQGRVHSNQAIIGFLNPSLYMIANSNKYSTDFHQITTGNNGYYLGSGYPAQPGLNLATGLGSLNAANLYSDLVGAAGVPAPPTTVTASAGNGQATISFSGASANGSAITQYTVTSSTGGKTATGTASPITVTGLTNGSAYTFTVTATNSIGTSVASAASNSVIPVGLPSPPTIVTASAGNAQATISFSGALANGSAITQYTVTSSTGGRIATGTMSPITVTGLTNGTAYTFSVKATNGVGMSVASAASNSVTPQAPVAPPAVPTILSAMPGNNQVALTWSVSATATSYNVRRTSSSGTVIISVASPSNQTNSSSISYTDTGVTNNIIYTYAVAAVNSSNLSSAYSNQWAVEPFAPAVVPTNLAAQEVLGQISLTWQGDSRMGVSGYSGWYHVLRTQAGGVMKDLGYTTTNKIIDGAVLAGVAYSYTVNTYINVYGVGNNSAYSAPLTFTPFAAPSGVTITGYSNGQVSLSWKAVVGATSYNVSRSTVNSSIGFVKIANVPSPANQNSTTIITYTNTGLNNSITYYYEVSAVNSSLGESANTSAVGIKVSSLMKK